jgi:hypothetical protein
MHLFADDSPMWMYLEWPSRTSIVAGSGRSGTALLACHE